MRQEYRGSAESLDTTERLAGRIAYESQRAGDSRKPHHTRRRALAYARAAMKELDKRLR